MQLYHSIVQRHIKDETASKSFRRNQINHPRFQLKDWTPARHVRDSVLDFATNGLLQYDHTSTKHNLAQESHCSSQWCHVWVGDRKDISSFFYISRRRRRRRRFKTKELRRVQRCLIDRVHVGYFPRNSPGLIKFSQLLKYCRFEDIECFIEVGSILGATWLLDSAETSMHDGNFHHFSFLPARLYW